MDISIIFPTYNGETTIRYTLDSLLDMDMDGLEWELLVCNNNSTDNTMAILNEYTDKLPLKVFKEKQQGMSPSLNCLLEHAQGELIIMTNDDVILDESWGKNYLALAKSKPDFAIFGGKIVPHFLADKPNWYEEFKYKHVAFAVTPEKFKEQEVGAGSIFGPSMAIRKSTLDEGVRFNPKIGPNGGEYEMGCESDFLSRLSAKGYKCWFSESILLEHIIRPWQFKLSWILKRGRRYGLSMFYKEKMNNFANTKTFFNIPLWRINLYLESLFLSKFRSNNKSQYANYVWEVGFFKGYLKSRMKN